MKNHKTAPTIKFSELVHMTNQYEPHKVVKQRWHKLLVDAEVFGEPHLMRQFIMCLIVLKDHLEATEQFVTWDHMVWDVINQVSPENWVCV